MVGGRVLGARQATDFRGVSDDWYHHALDNAAHAARELREALDAFEEVIVDSRRQRAKGVPFLDILDSDAARKGYERRVAVNEAIAFYRTAVMRLRAAVVRSLVEVEGMTLTAVAKRLRISRQMASRLYGSNDGGVRRPDEGLPS